MAEKVKVVKGPGPRGMGPRPKVEKPGQVMKRIFAYIFKNYKIHCFLVVVFILLSAAATLRGTLFMRSLIDDYVVPLLTSASSGSVDYGPLASALLSLAGIYAIGVASAYVYNRIMVNVSQGTLKNLRLDLFTNMESLPIKYFDTHAHGDIMSIYTNDVDTMRQLIGQSMPQVINSMVTVVMTFVSMIVLNIPLTILTIVMVGVMTLTAKKLTKLSGAFFIAQQKSIGSLNGFVEEMVNGQKVVKVFCHEEKSLEEFKQRNEELRVNMKKANTFANILMPINANLGNISYVLCAVIGAILALKGYGGLTLGTLVSFMTLNKNFTQPITQISQQLNAIVMALAGADRVFHLLDEKSETDDGCVELVNAKIADDGTITECKERTGVWAWKDPREHKQTYTKLIGDVVFNDVDFGYDEKKIVLHNIDLYATPGQKIAFVGSTGAGKTTITNLINRFYDIDSGQILMDGFPITQIARDSLRRNIAMVLQDTHLFTGTVRENIRYGRLDATDEEVEQAAKMASAHSFIIRLEHGYDTVLEGDGANLSQGQRQLINIARAAISKAPILILDEATSSVDTRTEKHIEKGMDRLMAERTTLVIAHRLSTVRNANAIMVLEQGEIIERGDHDALLAQNGRYHELYTGKTELD